MLPPISNNLLQPMSVTSNNNNNNTTNGAATTASSVQPTNVGATWSGNLKAGNLNIDLDNLLVSKSGKSGGPAPSMNALKTQSPAKNPLNVQTTGGFPGLSPMTSPNVFGAQQNIPQNQAAFANFGAFQKQPQPQQQNHSNNNNGSSAFDLFQ